MKKEQLVNETLESLNGLRNVSLPEGLRKRLESIPREVVILDQRIPMRAVWMAAASLFLLIALNVGSVSRYKKTQQQNDTSIYSEYFSYLDDEL